MKMIPEKGFTIIELLVVATLLALFGVIFVDSFLRSLQGGTKAEILSSVKQNGQSAMDVMEKTIRSSDRVVCPTDGAPSSVIVIEKERLYTRFRFNPPKDTPPAGNGFISVDNISDCTAPLPLPVAYAPLTNINEKNGVSVINGSFKLNHRAGFKDVVLIEFNLEPAVAAPLSLTSTIDGVTFSTAVVLR